MALFTELKKAIQTTSGDGAYLLPYDLDPLLHEELQGLQPLTQLLSVLPGRTKIHEYRLRTSHPAAWFEGETTPANQQAAGYTSKTVALKIMRNWGGVSGFAQAVDEEFVNALAEEITASLQGMADTIEYSALFGTSNDIGFTGDAYQFSGILPRLYSYANTNVVDAAGAKVTLDMLDQAIAKSSVYRGVRNDPKLWLMGTRMKQVVDGLQTRVSIPLRSAELFDGKITLGTYDGIPVYETNYLVPSSTSTSPSDLAGTDSGAGTLADDTYYYNISSVTADGEQTVGTEANVTTTGGNSAVVLTWTADSSAKLYMIWRGLSTGNANLQLLDVIPAKTYDSAGTVNGTVATYTDTGAKTPKAGIRPLASGEQTIALINTNPLRGAAFVGKIDDMGRPVENMVSYVDLARTKDSYDFMVKSYLTLRLVHPNLVAAVRNVKLA